MFITICGHTTTAQTHKLNDLSHLTTAISICNKYYKTEDVNIKYSARKLGNKKCLGLELDAYFQTNDVNTLEQADLDTKNQQHQQSNEARDLGKTSTVVKCHINKITMLENKIGQINSSKCANESVDQTCSVPLHVAAFSH